MTPGVTALDRLAAACGVLRSFTGADGRERRASDDVMVAVLRSLGHAIDRPRDAVDQLRSRQREEAERLVEPVVVHRIGRSSPVTVTLSGNVDPDDVTITCTLEQADVRQSRLAPLIVAAATGDEGDRVRRYQIDLSALGPDPIPPGRHTLRVEIRGPGGRDRAGEAIVISAPPCPTARRGWGLFMPIHAMRTDEDWGTGTYRDMAELGRWAGSLGASMVGTWPLYPSYLDGPVDPSPYRPVSRLAYNELYIEPRVVPEFSQVPDLQLRLSDPHFSAGLAAARASDLVDYEAVARRQRSVLGPMASALSAGSERARALHAFGLAHPELVAYAEFRARREGGDHGTEPERITYHLYCQWVAASQLSAVADVLPLYADLPIGVHPDGFDPRWSPQSFMSGLSVGAPPDPFFRNGQNWGFAPLHPNGIRRDGYDYVGAVLRRALLQATCLRIDHVMSLQRLYVIPDGAEAGHGTYVTYAADELHALVSLQATRTGTVVVGEDLGTVPPQVRCRMAEDRMERSWVYQFEATPELPRPEAPEGVLAALGTHDLPRFAAFVWGADIDEAAASAAVTAEEATAAHGRRETLRLAMMEAFGVSEADHAGITAALYRGCLRFLAGGPADLVLVDLEELWGEPQPQNRPGTGAEADNWRRRAALTLAQVQADPDIEMLLREVQRARIGEPVPVRA
jgi:4-alpha-glucanotransferase